MLRYEDSTTKHSAHLEEGDTGYFDYFEGGGENSSATQMPLNESFNTTSTGVTGISGFNHSASSSKAVLAALRALQDKIRRLETERASALDEAAQLRSQLKSQEIEAEHNKEKDILHSQKSLQEARMSYERVLTEKDDLEKSLKLTRTQNDQVQEHLQELREKNKQLEEMKTQAEQRLAEMESHIAKFEGEMEKSQRREADLSNAMVWETKRHEEEMFTMKQQIASLNAEYNTSAKERADKDAKLIELDHLVGQLLSVNETLICQISGKRISSVQAAAAPPKRGLKKKKKASVVPRAAKVGTASSNAKNEAGAARRQATTASKALASSRSMVDEVSSKKELLGMHEMYVSLANSITGKSQGRGLKNVSKISGSSTGGGKIKKSIGKSTKDTQMRRRREEDGAGAGSVLTSSSLFSEDRTGASEEVTVSTDLDAFEKKYMTPGGQGTSSSFTSSPAVAHMTSHTVPVLSASTGSPGLSQPELSALINSLEDEFEGLNNQYQRILQQSNDKSKNSEDTSQELVSVIQRLHKKGEQLRALKSPTK